MTTDEPVVDAVDVDPLAQWRHLPSPPRREDLITSQQVTPARGVAETVGDPEHEFMLRHGGG